MDKDKVVLSDIRRILFGEAPAEFLLEVFVRSVVTYAVLIVVLRILGKRMSGRLTNTEMAVMLMFGAVVSSAMQIPDRGVVEGCFVLFLVVMMQRGYTLWTVRSRKVEQATLGNASLVIKDGVIQPAYMNKELLSHAQLARMLRTKQIMQLGEVRRAYMEVNGSFSIVKAKEAVPGLSVLPEQDDELQMLFEVDEKTVVCKSCGFRYNHSDTTEECLNCSGRERVKAVSKKTTK